MWGRIILRSADSPTGWASATARGGWIDEAGARTFTREILEEAQARVAVRQGRLLLTTTIYDLGAIKQMYYDPHQAGNPDIEVIQFDSTENPEFSPEEFERLRATMPTWKFNQRYRGLYERPAGLIYDCLDLARHTLPRFSLPDSWPRYGGLDFGGVNTAGVFLVKEMVGDKWSGRYIVYREYFAGERSAAEHTMHLLRGEPRIPVCAGGSKSEGQWRREFAQGGTVRGQRVTGLPIHAPTQADVEVGINRVFGAFAMDRLVIFDDCKRLLDEIKSYSRELDEMNEPTEKIENKECYHHADALRYIISYLHPDKPSMTHGSPIGNISTSNASSPAGAPAARAAGAEAAGAEAAGAKAAGAIGPGWSM
jgi:hypothetical protein